MSSLKPVIAFGALLVLTLPFAFAQPQTGTPVDQVQATAPKDANPGELPKTGATSVKTVIYGHFLQKDQDAPLNAQGIDRCEENLQIKHTMPVVATHVNKDYDLRFDTNWFTMFSSAGLVEFGSDCVPREHQEAGLAIPLKVKGDTITLFWYMSANPVPNGDSDTTPGDTIQLDAMSQIAIYAHIETGRNEGQGELLAQGDTGADDQGNTPTGAGRVTIINVPGQPDIYEFQVPLAVKKNTWPDFFSDGGGAGYIVVVSPYQIRAKEGDYKGTEAMQPDWRVRTGPKTPVRLVIDTENPLVTKSASLSVFNGAMFARWSVVSPWGSYDVDDLSIKASVMGPKEIDLRKVGLAEPLVIKRSLDHDGHFKPINVTWKFDYHKGELPDGDYMLHLTAVNFQGTYRIEEILNFKMQAGEPIDVPIIGRINDGGGEQTIARTTATESPNLGVAAATLALLSAVMVLRKRI